MSPTRLSGCARLATAFGCGALAALALPPLHALPLLLVALPALVRLALAAPSARAAAAVGFAFGWGHHLVGLYWVTHALLTDAERWWWLVPIAAPAIAAPLALCAIPPVLVARALPPGWRQVAGFAAAWTATELLRSTVLTGFPWNLLGSAWAFAAWPIQPAALVGAHGLSLATAALALTPLLPGWRPRIAAAGLLAAAAAWGAARLAAPIPPPPGPMVVLIQGNIAQTGRWDPDQRLPLFRQYVDLTAQALAAAPAGVPLIAIWPETSSPYLLAEHAEARALAATALPEGATLLAGTVRVERDPAGRPLRLFNSLVAFGPDAVLQATYDKIRLVPFGEYMPLAGLLPIRLVAEGMDFAAGGPRRPIELPGLPPFGALICYEVIFGGAVTPAPRPDWLVNITNDSWFGVSAGPWQHLAAARLRAVEEGLPLARAAQTGISALFDASGRRLGRLRLDQRGVLALALPAPRPPTLFARFGLVIPVALTLAVAAAALLGSLRVVKPRRDPPGRV